MSVYSKKRFSFRDPEVLFLCLLLPVVIAAGYIGIGLVLAGVINNALWVIAGFPILGVVACGSALVSVKHRFPVPERQRGVPEYAAYAKATIMVEQTETVADGFFWIRDGVSRFRSDSFGFDLSKSEWNPTFDPTVIHGSLTALDMFKQDSISIRSGNGAHVTFVASLEEWEASFVAGPAQPFLPVYPPLKPMNVKIALAENAPGYTLFMGLIALAIAWVEFELRRLTSLDAFPPAWTAPIATLLGTLTGIAIRSVRAETKSKARVAEIGAQG